MNGGLRPRSFFVLMRFMNMGSTGFNHHQARAANARHRAQLVVGGWLAGRHHLPDDLVDALGGQLRHATAPPEGASRRRAAATVRAWLQRSPHLPPDLVAAVHVLLPEVGQQSMADAWPLGLGADWPE